MLEIERQLNEVESELESIEGRMKRLTNQIEFSTISLNFTLPVGKTENGFVFPDLFLQSVILLYLEHRL